MPDLLSQPSLYVEKGHENLAFQAEFPEDIVSTTGKNGSSQAKASSHFEVFWHNLTYSVCNNAKSSALRELTQQVSELIASKGRKLLARLCNQTYASYDLQQKPAGTAEQVTVFRDLNGSFRSGEVTGILGPSGAGKTSLLNILSRQCLLGCTGSVGVISNDQSIKRRLKICTIPQHETSLGYLTVYESLLFASRLNSPSANHEKSVLRLSSLLGLDDCLHTLTKSISGGQQKRLSIGQEMFAQPEILILDEPTSGLDSSTCLNTLAVLKSLVRSSSRSTFLKPMAVVLTIHQPQKEAFQMLDKIYVMANGGTAIYNGPPSECTEFITKHIKLDRQSLDSNPALLMLTVASGELGNESIAKLDCAVRSAANKHQHQYQHSAELKRSSMSNDRFWYKTGVLSERWRCSLIRRPIVLILRILLNMSFPICYRLMSDGKAGQINTCPKYQAEYSLAKLALTDEYVSEKTQEDFNAFIDNMAVIYMVINSCAIVNIGIYTLTIVLDIRYSLKEHYNGLYPIESYLLANIWANLPLDIVLPISSAAAYYFLTGQYTGETSSMPDSYRILLTGLGMVMVVSSFQMMSTLIGVIFMHNMTSALFMCQAAILPFVLFSGFSKRVRNMPPLAKALSKFSSLGHALNIAFTARFGWSACPCNPKEFDPPREPTIVGVPKKLADLVEIWQSSNSDEENTDDTDKTNKNDVFKQLAKQISLFNTYGYEVKSCDQMVPISLKDFELDQDKLMYPFTYLLIALLVNFVVMIVGVKWIINKRQSL